MQHTVPQPEVYISLCETVADPDLAALLALEDAIEIELDEVDRHDWCGCGIDRDQLRLLHAVGRRMNKQERRCWMGRCAGALAAV